MHTTTAPSHPVTELRFRAMGSDAHLVLVGGSEQLAEEARLRIEMLERRWSRFLPTSEVSELNRSAGSWVAVSEDTRLLIERAAEAWRLTGGRFDPTVLGALLRAGYDTDFDRLVLAPDRAADHRALLLGCDDIELSGHRARLPLDTGFDPGGVGKGLAADLVAAELAARGVAGVCVNLGGDLRVSGTGPTGAGWTVAVDHPWSPTPVAQLGVADGAVATSTTLRRRWVHDGREQHHLIDPETGRPSDTDLTLVTVVAGRAWMAEVLAKAVLLRGSAHPFDIVDGNGAEAFTVDDQGWVLPSAGIGRFLDGAALPGRIDAPPETSGEAIVTSQLWWYAARAGGLVAWAMLAAGVLWGLALSTRVLGPKPRPNWMLDLHRFLGGAAVVFTAIHVTSILLDSYVHFGLAEVLVPLTGTWHPVAVAWGIVAMYLLLAVQLTSMLRRRLSKRAWRTVHFLSFPLFGLATLHALTAGTDRATWPMRVALLGTTAVVLAMTALRIHQATREPTATARPPRPRPVPADRRPETVSADRR